MQRFMVFYFSFVLIVLSGLYAPCFANPQPGDVTEHSEFVKNPDENQTPPAATGVQAPSDQEPMTDIFDIKSPEKIGFDKRLIKYAIYIILVLLVLCVLFFIFDYFMKRRRKNKNEETIAPLPEIEAYSQLDELKAAGDMEARMYYFRLTGIIRGYIGRRFGIDALEMTTEEFIPRINEIPLDKKLNHELKELLKTSDPVKFAGIPAQKEKMDDDFEFTKTFVKSTTPDPEELNND